MKHFTHTFRFLPREHRLLFMDPQTPGNLMDMLGGDNEAQPNANETNEGEVQPEAEVPQTTGDVINSADQQHQKVTQGIEELAGTKQKIEQTGGETPEATNVAEPVANELSQVTDQALQARGQVQTPQLDASTFASTNVPQPTVQTPPINQPELNDTAFTDTATSTETGPVETTDTIDDPSKTPEQTTKDIHSSVDAAAKANGLTTTVDPSAQKINILKDGVIVQTYQLTFSGDEKLVSMQLHYGPGVPPAPPESVTNALDAIMLISSKLPKKEAAKETPEKKKEKFLKETLTSELEGMGGATVEISDFSVDTGDISILVTKGKGTPVSLDYTVEFDAAGEPTGVIRFKTGEIDPSTGMVPTIEETLTIDGDVTPKKIIERIKEDIRKEAELEEKEEKESPETKKNAKLVEVGTALGGAPWSSKVDIGTPALAGNKGTLVLKNKSTEKTINVAINFNDAGEPVSYQIADAPPVNVTDAATLGTTITGLTELKTFAEEEKSAPEKPKEAALRSVETSIENALQKDGSSLVDVEATVAADGTGSIIVKKASDSSVLLTYSVKFKADGTPESYSPTGEGSLPVDNPVTGTDDLATKITDAVRPLVEEKEEEKKHPKQTATLTSIKTALEGSSYKDKITVTEPSLNEDGTLGEFTITNKASGNTLKVILQFTKDGSEVKYSIGSSPVLHETDATKIGGEIVEAARSLAEDVENPKEERTKALQGVETTVEGTFAGKGIKLDVVFDAESGLVTVNNKEGAKLIAFTVSFDAAGKPTGFKKEGAPGPSFPIADAADLATKITDAVRPLVEEKEEEEKDPEKKKEKFLKEALKSALEGMGGATVEVSGIDVSSGDINVTVTKGSGMPLPLDYTVEFDAAGEPTGVIKATMKVDPSTGMATVEEETLTIDGAVTPEKVIARIKEDIRKEAELEEKEDPGKEVEAAENNANTLADSFKEGSEKWKAATADLESGSVAIRDVAVKTLEKAKTDLSNILKKNGKDIVSNAIIKKLDGLIAKYKALKPKEEEREGPEKTKETALKGVETAVEGAFTTEGVTVDVDAAAGTIVVKNKEGGAVATYKVTFDAAGKPTEFTAEGGGALPVSVTDAADLATKITDAVRPLVEEKEEEEKDPEKKKEKFLKEALKSALEGMGGATVEVSGIDVSSGDINVTVTKGSGMPLPLDYTVEFDAAGEPTGVIKATMKVDPSTGMATVEEETLTIDGAVTPEKVIARIKEDIRKEAELEEKEEDEKPKETVTLEGGTIDVPKDLMDKFNALKTYADDHGFKLGLFGVSGGGGSSESIVLIRKEDSLRLDTIVGTGSSYESDTGLTLASITHLRGEIDKHKEEKEGDPEDKTEKITIGGKEISISSKENAAKIKDLLGRLKDGVTVSVTEAGGERSVSIIDAGTTTMVLAFKLDGTDWKPVDGWETKFISELKEVAKKKEKPELRKAREKAEATYTRWEGRFDGIKAQVESDDKADMGATLRNKAVKELRTALKALKEAGADNDDTTVKKLKGLVEKYTELKTKEEKEKLATLPNLDDLKNQNAKYLKNLSKYAKNGDWTGYDKMVKWAMDKRAFQFHKFPKHSEIRNYALKSWRFFKGLHDRLSTGVDTSSSSGEEPPEGSTDPGDTPPSSPDSPGEGSERLRGNEHPSLRRGTMNRLGDATGNGPYKPYGEVLRSTPMARQEALNQYLINLSNEQIDVNKFPQYKHLGANPTLRDLHRSWGPKYRKLNADLNAVDAKNGQPAGTSWNEWVRAWKDGRSPNLSADAMRITSAFEAAVNADPLFLKICKDIDAIVKGRAPSSGVDSGGEKPDVNIEGGAEGSEGNISEAVAELESLLEELKGKTSLSEEDVKSFAERLQKVLDAINGVDESDEDSEGIDEDDEGIDEDDEDIDEDDEDIDEDIDEDDEDIDEDIDEDRDEKRERIDSEIADDLEDADFDLDALEDDYRDELSDIESDMEDIEDDITKLEDNIDKWEEKADRLRDKKRLSRSQKRQLEKLEERIEEAEDEIADLEDDLDELEEEEDTAKDKLRALRRFSKRAKPFLRAVERIADEEIREDLQKLQLTPTGIRFEKQSGREIRERSDLGKLIDKIFKSEPGEEISYKDAQKKLDKWLDKDSDRERDIDPDDDDKRAELTETILDDFEASALGKRPKKRDIKVIETRDGTFQVLVRKQLILDGGADEGMVDDLTDTGDWEKKGTRLLSPEADTMEDLTNLIEDDLLALLP